MHGRFRNCASFTSFSDLCHGGFLANVRQPHPDGASRFNVAFTTLSPCFWGTGTGSPVRADSSTPEVPKSTIPAAWIFAPGGTFTRLPSKSSFVSTSRSTKLCLLFNEQSSLSSNELTETQWRHQCFPCFAFKPLTKQEKRYQHRGRVQISNWAVSVPPTILLSHWFQMTPTLTFRICRIWLRCLTK